MSEKKHWIVKYTHDRACDLSIVKSEKMPDPALAAGALGWDVKPGSDLIIISSKSIPDVDEFLKYKMGQPKHKYRPLKSDELKALGAVLDEYQLRRLREDPEALDIRADMFNYDDTYIDIELQEDIPGDNAKDANDFTTQFSQVKLLRSWLHRDNADKMEKILDSIKD
jgi:hypothetical protein